MDDGPLADYSQMSGATTIALQFGGDEMASESLDNSIEPKSLDRTFFERPAEIVAPDLIGCYLYTTVAGDRVGGMIIETEAYDANDPASHCHPEANLRRRAHSDAMLLGGGHAYIHEDRGMSCLNMTCDREGFGSAVLIRALLPREGVDLMTSRRGAHPAAAKQLKERRGNYKKLLCNGPSKVGEALQISRALDKASLFEIPFEMRSRNEPLLLLNGLRINIEKGVEAVWRWGHGNFKEYLSRPFKN
jgi:DNA-3-methyladenine glycosylase